MAISKKEEGTLKVWLAWQKQASVTNDVSFQMDARRKALQDIKGEPLTSEDIAADEDYQNLRAKHDVEAAKCVPLMKAFKDAVKLV